MAFSVMLFGAEAAALGQRSIEIESDASTVTADELKARLATDYPRLGGITACRVAVNQRFVAGDHTIEASDEIALVGPVSGG